MATGAQLQHTELATLETVNDPISSVLKNIPAFYQCLCAIPLYDCQTTKPLPSPLKLAAEYFIDKNYFASNGVPYSGELYLIKGALEFFAATDIRQTLSDNNKAQIVRASIQIIMDAPELLTQAANLLKRPDEEWNIRNPDIRATVNQADSQRHPNFTRTLLIKELESFARAFKNGFNYEQTEQNTAFIPPIIPDIRLLSPKN